MTSNEVIWWLINSKCGAPGRSKRSNAKPPNLRWCHKWLPVRPWAYHGFPSPSNTYTAPCIRIQYVYLSALIRAPFRGADAAESESVCPTVEPYGVVRQSVYLSKLVTTTLSRPIRMTRMCLPMNGPQPSALWKRRTSRIFYIPLFSRLSAKH